MLLTLWLKPSLRRRRVRVKIIATNKGNVPSRRRMFHDMPMPFPTLTAPLDRTCQVPKCAGRSLRRSAGVIVIGWSHRHAAQGALSSKYRQRANHSIAMHPRKCGNYFLPILSIYKLALNGQQYNVFHPVSHNILCCFIWKFVFWLQYYQLGSPLAGGANT